MARPKGNQSNLCGDREWLYQKRIVERLTVKEIGLLAGITRKSVDYWIEKHDIPKPDVYIRSEKTKKKMITLSCDFCGVSFEKEAYYINGKKERNKYFFCSKNCKYAYDKERMSGDNNHFYGVSRYGEDSPRWMGGKIKLPCTVCSKIGIEYHPYQVREFESGLKVPCCSAVCSSVIGHMSTPTSQTSIELKIQEKLDCHNINYIPQFIFKDRYSVDFYLPDYDIVIECDGDYWHGNPQIYTNPNEWQIKTINKDKRKNAFITKHGSVLFRFWETAINNNLDICFEQILNKITEIVESSK